MLFGFMHVILFYSRHKHVCGHLQGAENKNTNTIYHTSNIYFYLLILYTITIFLFNCKL